MRDAVVVGLVLVLVGCASGRPAPPTTSGADSPPAGDVGALLEGVARIHPDPWHDVSEADFRAAADELATRYAELQPDERLVELHAAARSARERDGHSGIFPLDPEHESG